jgi:hypothetical protein
MEEVVKSFIYRYLNLFIQSKRSNIYSNKLIYHTKDSR